MYIHVEHMLLVPDGTTVTKCAAAVLPVYLWNVQEAVLARAVLSTLSARCAGLICRRSCIQFPFPFHLLHRACGSALISMATVVESLADLLATASIEDSAAGHVWVDTPRGLATALDNIRAADMYAFDCEGVELGR